MGSIQDITKLIRKGPELIASTNSMKLNRKSVVAGAKDATFQFPFLISDSNPVDMANATVQLFDRVYAEYTKTWISVNAMYDVTLDPTPTDYLKKIHQNVKFEMAGVDSVEEMESAIDGCYNGQYELYMTEDKSYGILFNRANKELRAIMESNKEALREYLSEYDLSPLYTEADDDEEESLSPAGDLAKNIISARANMRDDAKRQSNLDNSTKMRTPHLTDRDVKKSNDLMPYAMEVRLVAVNDKKEFVQFIDIVVGVKTIMHRIPSQTMVENIARAVQNKSLLFKMLRWTTGEISLMKDIVLNISDIKSDILEKQKKNPYFATLKRLRNKRVSVRNFTVPTALIPNATIAISREEVDQLKEQYAVDVMDTTIAKRLIDSLFLMAFVVIDEGSDTVSVLYNEAGVFETYSVDALQRENRIQSRQLTKAIGSLVTS